MTNGGPDGDEQLLGRAASGDRRAFDTIVQRHKGAIYAFVRRYVGDPDDAYDVLQNTFVSAWLGLGKYDLKRPLLPWLRTIALNKCRDHGRRTSVRRILLRAKAAEPPDEDGSQNGFPEQDARLRRLDRAILQLRPFYREPLLLTTVSGLSNAETATILKTSAKAVEMRIRRARQKLAVALGEIEPEG